MHPIKKRLSGEIEPVWIEYKNKLKKSDYDRGIDYKIENHHSAFKEVFIEFFNTVRKNERSLDEYSEGVKFEDNLDAVLSDVVDKKALLDEEVFEDLFQQYVDEETSTLLNFVGTIHTGVINYDLLSEEDDIDELNFSKASDQEKDLLLDTNTLIGLLCETDEIHPVVSSMCKRSRESGYDIYYTENTKEELKHVINRARKSLSGFPGEGNSADVDNQFVRDFKNKRKKNNITKSQYITYLDRWPDTLEEEWEVKLSHIDSSLDKKERRLVKNWVDKLDEMEGDGEKSEPQIKHDTNLIASTVKARREVEKEVAVGPFAVSNNNSLLSINKFGKGELWKKGVVLHPQDWLDYLVAFSTTNITKEDKEEVAKAVLSTATEFDDEVDLDGYIEILAARANLSSRSQSHLRDLIYGTELEKKLTSAIERGDHEELESTGKELLEELNELIKEDVDKNEKIKRISSENIAQKERINQLEEVVSDLGGVKIENTQNVEQNVEVTVEQETKQQLEFFEEELREAVGGSFEDSEIEEPPEDYSDPREVKEWLSEVESVLSSGTNIAEDAKKLKPMLTGLMALFGL